MTEIETAIADNHASVDQFIASARALDAGAWTTPRAPGKWTPAQIAEHLAIAYEYSRKVVAGTAGRGLPFFIRPVVRRMFVVPVLRSGRMARPGKAPKIFLPSAAPGPQPDVIARLRSAANGFESDLRARPASDRPTLFHPFFGTVAAADYVKLQAIHARHHRGQLPPF